MNVPSMPSLGEIIAVLILVGLGFLVMSVLATLLGLLPAIVAAVIVYVLTGRILYAAITFVIVAFLFGLVKHR